MSAGPAPSLCCVILTMGDRRAELERAVRSVCEQSGPPIDVLVVGNGVSVDPPAGARAVALPENLGIPAGRNAGVAATTADVILFLDDDGWLAEPGAADRLRELFDVQPGLGVVSFRVRDPAGGPGERRHVPRLRAGDPHRSSYVTTFLGGACAVRRSVIERCGGYPGEFFFGHEETDLAWRALDAGFAIAYDADVVMYHAALPPSRHAHHYRLTARNRVWLARRLLPWPLAVVYLLDWAVLTAVRTRNVAALRAWWGGFAEGLRAPCGPRRPISWRTALRMTRLGRPPVI